MNQKQWNKLSRKQKRERIEFEIAMNKILEEEK